MNATKTNRAIGMRAIIAVATAIALIISMGLPAVMGDQAHAVQSKAHITLTAPASISIDQGDQYRIAAKASKGAKLQYKSSKKSVATVSGKGVVKAKRAGKTTITVTAKKGKKVVKKKVKVVVVEPQVANDVAVEQPDASGVSYLMGTQMRELDSTANVEASGSATTEAEDDQGDNPVHKVEPAAGTHAVDSPEAKEAADSAIEHDLKAGSDSAENHAQPEGSDPTMYSIPMKGSSLMLFLQSSDPSCPGGDAEVL